MEVEVDHYEVLGVPSGEEGSKLTEGEIVKAYRLKALKLHPDKNPNDPNAQIKFYKLTTSYEILKDEKARKLFDDLLRVKRERQHRTSQYDSKRRKMMSDLDERERASFAPDPVTKAQREEERIAKKFQEEITRIRAMHAKNSNSSSAAAGAQRETTAASQFEGLDQAKMLKVTWEGNGDAYSAERLREVFGQFGEVEDVVIRAGTKKRRPKSALVVMKSKDDAVSAMGTVCGDLSNPLLVVPLHKVSPMDHAAAAGDVEPDAPKVSELVGAGYQAKEDSILQKLMKAAEKQKAC